MTVNIAEVSGKSHQAAEYATLDYYKENAYLDTSRIIIEEIDAESFMQALSHYRTHH